MDRDFTNCNFCILLWLAMRILLFSFPPLLFIMSLECVGVPAAAMMPPIGTPPDPMTFNGFSHFPPLFFPPETGSCFSLSVGCWVTFDSASF